MTTPSTLNLYFIGEGRVCRPSFTQVSNLCLELKTRQLLHRRGIEQSSGVDKILLSRRVGMETVLGPFAQITELKSIDNKNKRVWSQILPILHSR